MTTKCVANLCNTQRLTCNLITPHEYTKQVFFITNMFVCVYVWINFHIVFILRWCIDEVCAHIVYKSVSLARIRILLECIRLFPTILLSRCLSFSSTYPVCAKYQKINNKTVDMINSLLIWSARTNSGKVTHTKAILWSYFSSQVYRSFMGPRFLCRYLVFIYL